MCSERQLLRSLSESLSITLPIKCTLSAMA
jgi:hypothetical protein